MINIRFAQKDDEPYLKQLWKLCFADDDNFIEFYFKNRYSEHKVIVLLSDGIIASMLTIIDITQNCRLKPHKAAMIYAVATHPDYQKRGFAARLMAFCDDYLIKNEYDLSVLVPAGQSLFGYYNKQGYKNGFTLRETYLLYENINCINNNIHCKMQPVKADDYNKIRNNFLTGTDYIQYNDREIEYQKKLSQFSGADIYSFELKSTVGCIALEIFNNTLLIKELLIPDDLLNSVLVQIVKQYKYEKYILRTPAFCDTGPGENIKAFGMIKSFCNSDLYLPSNNYLGLAFD